MDNDIDLIDELSAQTTERIESPTKVIEPVIVNNEDFTQSSVAESASVAVPPALALNEEEPKATPKESAESLVSMLDLAITSTTLPFVIKKLKNKFGAELLAKADLAEVKELVSPDKLTEEEKILLTKYRKFEKILSRVQKDIPFTTDEITQLLPPTERFCKKRGIEVSEDLAFGVHLLKIVSSRVIDVVMI